MNPAQPRTLHPALIVLVVLAVVGAALVITGSIGPWLATEDCEGDDCQTSGIDLEESGYLFFVGDDIFGLQEGWITIGLAVVGLLAAGLALLVRPRAVPLAIGGLALLTAGVVGVIDWASLSIFISDLESVRGVERFEVGWGVQVATISGLIAGVLCLVAIAIDSSASRRAVAGASPPGYAPPPGY